jgi:hypothetical protein
VIPSPFGVILSEAKDLGSSLRVVAVKTCRRAKKKLQRFFAPLRMTGEALGTKPRGCRYDASNESNP